MIVVYQPARPEGHVELDWKYWGRLSYTETYWSWPEDLADTAGKTSLSGLVIVTVLKDEK